MATQSADIAPTADRTTWALDPQHTHAEFAVRHLMISTVKGRFAEVSGALQVDEADPARSSVEIELDVASIDTRVEQRDQHLRSADFFDAENHPKITFRSRRIEPTGDKRYRVVGDLTIRGTTHEIELEVSEEGRGKDPWGGERVGFSVAGRVNRGDYGLKWNQALETGGVVVGEEVKLQIDAEFVKQS